MLTEGQGLTLRLGVTLRPPAAVPGRRPLPRRVTMCRVPVRETVTARVPDGRRPGAGSRALDRRPEAGPSVRPAAESAPSAHRRWDRAPVSPCEPTGTHPRHPDPQMESSTFCQHRS